MNSYGGSMPGKARGFRERTLHTRLFNGKCTCAAVYFDGDGFFAEVYPGKECLAPWRLSE